VSGPDVKPLDDAAAHSLDGPLGVAAVANVAHPQSAHLEKAQHVIPYWRVKASQIRNELHPQSLCQPDVIYANSITKRPDPSNKGRKSLSKALRYFVDPKECPG
jgi:hypothetical protein